MNFTKVMCWHSEHVKDVIVSDAVTPSDGVFLATHTPIELFRREFGDGGGSQRCSEEDLLHEFLREDADMLLLPITGGSGRGKSHLVRWLQARIPATDARRIVYVPKYQTNLRGVIDEILRGMEGETATTLRVQLAQAADNIDERTAPDRLLDALAIRIGLLAASPAPQTEVRRYACQGLPTLLREDLFREVWLAEHGVIRRFVSEALKGREKGDRDAPFAFTIEDLPRSITAVKKASERAQSFYRHLLPTVDLQRACVEVLNECLAPAIAEVVGLKSGDLQRILLELRRLLLAQCKELVILIEDFAILQGVQRELLEAIVEAPTRGGKRVLCNIRVAMAVTSGYFASLDTVLTRAKFEGYVYNLDIPHSDGRQVRQEVIEFVARYLNANRLGRRALDRAFRTTGPERRPDWVPNACADCDHRTPCHEAFGTSAQEWGLYPFNALSLERMLYSRSGDQFDPREILGGVLNHTLYTHADDLREGKFPNKEYIERFRSDRVDPVAGSLEAAVAEDKKDSARRLPLLVFWGGNPREVVNLHPAIHEAFAIPQLRTAAPPSPPSRPSKAAPPSVPVAVNPHAAALDQAVERIDRWKDGTYTLDQGLRRDLALCVAEAIGERIEWNDFCCPKLVDKEQEFAARSVRFEAAAGEAAAVPTVSIRINRSVDNTRALQAILLYRHHRHWRFEGGAAYLRAFSRAVDRWAAEVRRQYEVPNTAELVEHLVAQAAFGARVLGEARARAEKNADLLSAALERGPDPEKHWSSSMPPWVDFQAAIVRGSRKTEPRRWQLLERLLFLAARSQANGSPQAVDAALLLAGLREIRATWRPARPPANAPAWLLQYFERIDSKFDLAVNDERDRLLNIEQEIRPQFAHAIGAKAFKEAIADAVTAVGAADTAARGQGVRRPGSPDKVNRLSELGVELTAPATGYGVLFEVWEHLGRPEAPLGETLARLAANRGNREEQLREFVDLANEFLVETGAFVQQQRSVLQSATGVGAVVDEIQSSLEDLTGLLLTAKGGQS